MIHDLKAKLRSMNLSPVEKTVQPAQPQVKGCLTVTKTFPFSQAEGSSSLKEITAAELQAVFRMNCEQNLRLEDILFIDTETTGLGRGTGILAFLVGVGYVNDGEIVVRQYLMRDYDEEYDMLLQLSKLMEGFKAAASFNGRGFDMPILESRAILNRIRLPLADAPHFDILFPARRQWKYRLESCSLTSLEENILGIRREGDIPGGQIPEVFQRFVRTGQSAEMDRVMEHNRQDVLSMPLIMARLCEAWRNPHLQSEGSDLYATARMLLAAGDDRALECMQKAALRHMPARRELSLIYKRAGRWEDACRLWQTMTQRREGGIFAWVELAKYYEHSARDADAALFWVDGCLQELRRSGITSKASPLLQPLYHRRNRLIKKIQGGK